MTTMSIQSRPVEASANFLDAPKPTIGELIDWIIRFYPASEPRLPDGIQIQRLLSLYMHAYSALAKWETLRSQFAHDELVRLERRLVASINDADNTMRQWLTENTSEKEERVRFKVGIRLVEAITALRTDGVAVDKNDDGSFKIERLRGSFAIWDELDASGNVTVISYNLTENTACDFLRLRRIQRDKDTLQTAWRASLSKSDKPILCPK